VEAAPAGRRLWIRLPLFLRGQVRAHHPRRLLARFLVHEEISAVLTPSMRIAALVVVLTSYFVAVFWPLHWQLPRQVRNQAEVAADGHAVFTRPGLLRTYNEQDWLADVVAGAPFKVHLEAIPAEPHPRFVGRLFGLSNGSFGRLVTIDRDHDDLLIHLRARGTNLDGGPPLRIYNVFRDGVPITIDLELVGKHLRVAVDGENLLEQDYRADPRKRWSPYYHVVLGSDLNVRRYFLGEITAAMVSAGAQTVDLLEPGVLAGPSRIFFLSREPRLNLSEDLRTVDAYQNVAGFVPLGMVAAIWPGATIFSVLATGLAVSGTIEFVQLTVPGRVPSVDDVVTNVTGAGIGWLVIFALRRLLDLWGQRRAAVTAARRR
jgi:hypothetical protein